MINQLRRAVVIVPIIVIGTTAVALAAGPVKGSTYKGATAHGKEAISLKVSGSGKAVTLSVPTPPGYSAGCSGPTRQITKAAAISSSGSFNGSIAYEFQLVRKIVVKLFVSGTFSGRTVKGTARSVYPFSRQCGGSTGFSARAK
jgi:hypothetical protein